MLLEVFELSQTDCDQGDLVEHIDGDYCREPGFYWWMQDSLARVMQESMRPQISLFRNRGLSHDYRDNQN